MGLLDKLWDDVLAGPQPDSGLSRLRRHSTDAATAAAAIDIDEAKQRIVDRRRSAEYMRNQIEARRVSQGIAIVKTKPSPLQLNEESMMSSSVDKDELYPTTPTSSSTPPMSPSFASPSSVNERQKVWRSVFQSGKNQSSPKVSSPRAQPAVPTVYDWVVISALDK